MNIAVTSLNRVKRGVPSERSEMISPSEARLYAAQAVQSQSRMHRILRSREYVGVCGSELLRVIHCNGIL